MSLSVQERNQLAKRLNELFIIPNSNGGGYVNQSVKYGAAELSRYIKASLNPDNDGLSDKDFRTHVLQLGGD